MEFKDFLHQAWSEHATHTDLVAGRLQEGISLVTEKDQIPSMAHLIAHVMGEHLGQWGQGIELLHQLKALNFFDLANETHGAVLRSIVSLELAGGQRSSLEKLNSSDQIRALASAASALSAQNQTEYAKKFFSEALEKAQGSLPKEDPANRSLAISGHSLACTLEEKALLSESEIEFMILAAKSSRKYWEIAGTWLEVERAEYRLSQSFLKAKDFEKSKEHAQTSLRISQSNGAPALELFFAYEALALAEKGSGFITEFTTAREGAKSEFEKLSAEDKSWCELSLKKLLDL